MARVKYISREDLPEGQRYIYDDIASSRGMKKPPKPFEAMLNSPEGTHLVSALGAYLRFNSELPAAIRELVSSALAWELNCEFEAVVHGRVAQKAGVSDASLKAIHDSKSLEGVPENEAIYLRFAYELLRTHQVKDATFNPVIEKLGAKNTTDLIFLVGYYSLFLSAAAALQAEFGPIPPPPPIAPR